MYKILSATVIGILLASLPLPSFAQTILERLKTGENPQLTVVTRPDAISMVYQEGDRRVGYAMDLVNQVIKEESDQWSFISTGSF